MNMPRFEGSSARKQDFSEAEEQFFAKGEKKQKASHLRVVKNEPEPGFSAEENKFFASTPKNRRTERPVAAPNPFGEDEPGSALVRNKETGSVEALRADERFVTLKEAYQYLADKQAELTERKMALVKSGASSKALEEEQRALDRFRKDVDKSDSSEAAVAARYSGASLLIENPMYEEEDVSHPLKEGEYDVEENVDMGVIERERGELDELYRKRNELKRAADGIIKDLKRGDVEETFADWKRAAAESMKQEPIYPNYFPADMGKEMKRQKLVREAEETEAMARRKKGQPVVEKKVLPKQWELESVRHELAGLKARETVSYPEPTAREKQRAARIAELTQRERSLSTELEPHMRENIGSALSEILDELDEVQEAIIKQERNVQFNQKLTGSRKKTS